jgi:hypothetical protein
MFVEETSILVPWPAKGKLTTRFYLYITMVWFRMFEIMLLLLLSPFENALISLFADEDRSVGIM